MRAFTNYASTQNIKELSAAQPPLCEKIHLWLRGWMFLACAEAALACEIISINQRRGIFHKNFRVCSNQKDEFSFRATTMLMPFMFRNLLSLSCSDIVVWRWDSDRGWKRLAAYKTIEWVSEVGSNTSISYPNSLATRKGKEICSRRRRQRRRWEGRNMNVMP